MSPGLFYGLPRGVTTVWISRTIHNTLDRVGEENTPVPVLPRYLSFEILS